MKISLTYSYEKLYRAIIFLPFLLIFISEFLSFIYESADSLIKISAFLLMLAIIMWRKKLNLKFFLFSLPVMVFLIYNMIISFNINAAFEELLRYLFPVIILFYSYSVRNYFAFLFKGFIIFLILNIIFQFYNYIEWAFTGEVDWLKGTTGLADLPRVAGILRATGFVGYAAGFGFISYIAVILVYYFYQGPRKRFFINLFSIFTILSLSFKIMGVLLIFYFSLSKNFLKYLARGIVVFIVMAICFPSVSINLYEQFSSRISYYISKGNSARAESYRVMFENIGDLNFFGKGIGSFGGPASVKYNSPVFEEYHFNWYGTIYLKTTDTYFPHLFVEMGIVGALIYLVLLCMPLLYPADKKKFRALLFIYLGLFFDSLFSYGLNAPVYLISSLFFTFPILYHREENNNITESSNS